MTGLEIEAATRAMLPPNLPTAVRNAATITTSSIRALLATPSDRYFIGNITVYGPAR